jgi:hypothetical protein
MQLMNSAVLGDNHRSNMCLDMFHMTSTIMYGHAKNKRKPETAFPSVKEWNESEDGMIASGVSEFMNGFGDSRLVRHDLLVYQTLQFDEEMTMYQFFTQCPPILYMRSEYVELKSRRQYEGVCQAIRRSEQGRPTVCPDEFRPPVCPRRNGGARASS